MPRKKNSKNTSKEEEIVIPQIKSDFKIKKFDLTDKQKNFLKLSLNNKTNIFFISGVAGSAKTFISVLSALELMKVHEELELVYIRSLAESADKSIGALPGSIDEKFDPFLLPLKEKLEELLGPDDIKELLKSQRVTGIPVNFFRGASQNKKVVIVDEAQNMTFNECQTIITRIGKHSKFFFCGDPMQSDIGSKSGFEKMYNIFDSEDAQEWGIHCFEFNEEDIKRSEILKFIIKSLKSHKKISCSVN